MDPQRAKQCLLDRQERLAAFMEAHPEQLDELFLFTDAIVRAAAMASTKHLDLHTVTVLCDRIVYLRRTRSVHYRDEAPRCHDKVIYTLHGAQAKVKWIWEKGRGRMRVYQCPHCAGYHLTHTAHRDDDQQVA